MRREPPNHPNPVPERFCSAIDTWAVWQVQANLRVDAVIGRSDVNVKGRRVGNRENLGQVSSRTMQDPPAGASQLSPHFARPLRPFCMAIWQNICGRAVPKRGLGDILGLPFATLVSIRITGESP
jgi:hypothetical protein